MPKLILKLNDRELHECAVGFIPVNIGRLPDNTIVIDNPVVSARHARVFREGNDYVIEDLKSTNGTFVNGKPVARYGLREGDVVVIGKHSLLFTLAGAEQPEIAIGGVAIDAGSQRVIDGFDHARASQVPPVIPKTSIPVPPPRAGALRVIAGKSDRNQYPLTAMTTLIGKGDNAQIRTKGWFKPKVSAAIARKGDGFTVTAMGANVTVNNQKVSGRTELHDGDMIQVSGLTLEFRVV
jgi:pSer/pThr/pTyr-binding forkhead associated (FHA) protein